MNFASRLNLKKARTAIMRFVRAGLLDPDTARIRMGKPELSGGRLWRIRVVVFCLDNARGFNRRMKWEFYVRRSEILYAVLAHNR
jgi:hypothetical protein